MESRNDHAESGVRQHRPRSAARPAHRNRAAGGVVAQPVRRLPLLGAAGRRVGAGGARCMRSTDRHTARATRCQGISPSRRWWPPPNRRWTDWGSTEPVDWVGNAWGGHVGIRLAHRGAVAHADDHRHAHSRLHIDGEVDQGLAARRYVPASSGPTGFIVKQLFDVPRRRRLDCRTTRSGRDGRWRRSETPTATGCITRCAR